jgi:hypothetical protein
MKACDTSYFEAPQFFWHINHLSASDDYVYEINKTRKFFIMSTRCVYALRVILTRTNQLFP